MGDGWSRNDGQGGIGSCYLHMNTNHDFCTCQMLIQKAQVLVM